MQKDVREAAKASACWATVSTWDSGHHKTMEMLTLMILTTRNEDPNH